MLRLPTLLSLILTLICCGAAFSAPPAPRPYGGCGVLTLKQGSGWKPGNLALYQEPGLHRIAEKSPASLPRLAGDAAAPILAASARRGGWTRLFMDDAGRLGWLAETRGWEYASWREYLPGRTVKVLPGLKKGWYLLRSAPGEGGAELAAVTRDQLVQVIEVDEDWARLATPAGWFRWRDGDGRLTVSLQAGR